MVLVVIAQLLKQRCGRLGGRWLVVGDGVHTEMIMHDIRHGLGVGRGAGAAAPDGVVHLGQFIRHPVGNVAAGCRARVGT